MNRNEVAYSPTSSIYRCHQAYLLLQDVWHFGLHNRDFPLTHFLVQLYRVNPCPPDLELAVAASRTDMQVDQVFSTECRLSLQTENWLRVKSCYLQYLPSISINVFINIHQSSSVIVDIRQCMSEHSHLQMFFRTSTKLLGDC